MNLSKQQKLFIVKIVNVVLQVFIGFLVAVSMTAIFGAIILTFLNF